MDLQIKDVADLLNVSEVTVHRWLDDGVIPAYRIQDQYRFSRFEIEDWMVKHKNTSLEDVQKGGIKQFSLYRAVHKGGVIHDVAGETKEEVIRFSSKVIAGDLDLDPDVVMDLLLDRERQQPTALDNGVAVPHTRDLLLNKHYDVVTLVFPKEPIEYGALDGAPVHTLFFLFASEDTRHLHLLAKIAHLSSQPESLKFLQSKPTKAELLQFIRDWESRILTKN